MLFNQRFVSATSLARRDSGSGSVPDESLPEAIPEITEEQRSRAELFRPKEVFPTTDAPE